MAERDKLIELLEQCGDKALAQHISLTSAFIADYLISNGVTVPQKKDTDISADKIKRCYISGKITGTDDYLKRFAKAEDVLKSKGFETVNPARVCAELPNTFTHSEYMAVCMACLEQCDSIYMLIGWWDSKGAKMEHQLAVEKGLLIGYEDDVTEFNAKFGSGTFTACDFG